MREGTTAERDYIGNLRAIAGARHFSVSEQNLALLREKYDLSEEETEEMRRYCRDHDISIYDEESVCAASGTAAPPDSEGRPTPLTPEQVECKKLARIIADRCLHISTKRSREIIRRAREEGVMAVNYCGTSRIMFWDRFIRSSPKMKRFTLEELRFIVDHLPEETEEEMCFSLRDDADQALCDNLNDRLNSIIPQDLIRITRLFDD